MKGKDTVSLKHPEVLLLSFFGVGFFPKAPGTVGTIAILPFLYVIGHFNVPNLLFAPFLIFLTVGACYLADFAQRRFGAHDPSWIVLDEVVGMSWAWLFLPKHSLTGLLIMFVLFRFFDIVKIWPASYFDKQVSHGSGTILDDVVSGFMAGLLYLGASRLLT